MHRGRRKPPSSVVRPRTRKALDPVLASSGMSDAAPAAGAVAAEKKPLLRRIRRPPTSVVMTLLGLALTAWLFPAVARQWDDRQKATELRASLVAQIASASAHALTGGEAI